MIWDLFKEQIGYNPKILRNTIFYLVANIRNELISKKIGFITQVDQDDFKISVK